VFNARAPLKVNRKRPDVAAVTRFGGKGGFASRFSPWQAS